MVLRFMSFLLVVCIAACSVQGAPAQTSFSVDVTATAAQALPDSMAKAALMPIPLPTAMIIPTNTLTPTPTPLLAQNKPAAADKLQALLDRVAKQNAGVAMYVNVPGVGTWLSSSGVANHVAQTLVQPTDRFRIASVTKTFIATLILLQAQAGALSLDDTIAQWVPKSVPNGKHITLRQLLNQTSGLYDYLDYEFEARYFAEDPPRRVWQPDELVAHGVAHEPYFASGTPGAWHYSNTNYILLGMVVERATGMTLAEALHTFIFTPLGMQNSFLEEHDTIPGGFVPGYIGEQDFTDGGLSSWAAGGIISTAEDVGTFAQALFGGVLLNEHYLHEMLTFAEIDLTDDGIGYPIYGLGVTSNVEALALATRGIEPLPSQLTFDAVWGHIGGISGFKSVMAYLPDSGITLVVLTNQMGVQVVPVAIEGLHIVTEQQTSVKER